MPPTRRPLLPALLLLTLPLALASPGRGEGPAPGGYRPAPDAVRKLLDLPPEPAVALSPRRDYLVLADRPGYPSIADLARPHLPLAGLRLDPATSGPQLPSRYTGFTLQPVAGGKPLRLDLPPGARMGLPTWSPDGARFALLNTTPAGIEVWHGSPDRSELTRVPNLAVSSALGDPLQWLPDGKTLLVQAVPAGRGKLPEKPAAPAGPVVQESSGKSAPVRTYQDLLKNAHDEALFDHLATAQLARVDVATGKVTPVGKSAVLADCTPAPDGVHLLVTTLQRPYSYVHPWSAFPRRVEVWGPDGKGLYTVAELPLADAVPIEGVPTGPRQIGWRPDEPATLTWVTALDGGDPRRKAAQRDRVVTLRAPFTGQPIELARTEHRFASLTWGDKGLALLADYDREKRRRRTYRLDADDLNRKPALVWDRAVAARFDDPGTPLLRRLPTGQRVLRRQGDSLFLTGDGASAKGERPFLDRFELTTGKSARLFQSGAGEHESVVDVLSDDGATFLTRHESPTSPPNYRLRTSGKEEFRALTAFADRAPEVRQIARRVVTYRRDDGVPLSFTLYLPPGYREGTRLPTLVWAYPREFTDAATAGQEVGSANRYTRLGGSSHLFCALAGYAVIEATMPVVGSAEKANDTFVEQIVASAKAAIDKAAELGVTDPDRVAVAGHSYGAFMTANLLAHSDLFRAGIARSGAYNRTLTPFGFQRERRTLWEAPEVYARMSPLMHAQRINEPLLLIHGEADNNPGTFPVQSERLFQAVRGNGGTVRLVLLPHESHGYAARESVEQVLAEMIGWLDRHVKEAPRRRAP